MHPVELREAVTSPGGTTIAAIRELEQAGVRAAFLNAIQAAMERAKELASERCSDVEIVVADDPASVGRRLLAASARAGGHIVLTGGSTVGDAYERAAQRSSPTGAASSSGGATSAASRRTTSSRTTALAKGTLLDGLDVQPAVVHRMRGELGRDAGAEDYDRELDGLARFDLVLLGLGPRRAHRVALPDRRRSTSRSGA